MRPLLPVPLPLLQQTIARAVSCEGVGLHGGEPARVTLRPSRARSGIIFRRVDLERDMAARGRATRIEIPASLEGVSRVDHATTLSVHAACGPVSVGTVEHLIAALRGAGIDACTVEVDGPEVPILDGSSAPWMTLLESAGRSTLARPRRQMRILRPVSVELGGASVHAYPADEFRVTCSIDFSHEAIGRQEISLDVTPESFASQLAGARTFGFLREVEALRAAGLARGGSMENAIVIGDDGILNGPLRFEDEFVRHKALDLIGDLALVGFPLIGHVVARRAGHRAHVEFARELLASPSAWALETTASEPAMEPALLAGGGATLAAHSFAE